MKEYFAIPNNDQFDRINVTLTATSGRCSILPSPHREVLNIYGQEDQKTYRPNFESEIVKRTQHVNFDVKNSEDVGMGKALSSRILGDGLCKNNNWDIFLSDSKPLSLNLNYAVGEADVDLSGLPVENLRINTGNANVRIGYQNEIYNPVTMDSLYVKVDMGSLHLQQINLTKAKMIFAEVGFGKLYLDFSNPHVICTSNVSARVGAGSMEIYLSEKELPIMIKLNNSPLCHVKIPKSFKKINKNTYANSKYKPGIDHTIIFDLDVTMGHISFHYQ